MKNRNGYLPALIAAILIAMLAACASMGRPEGGPRDELPPVFIKSNPRQGQLNVKQSRFDIYFDENLKLDDVTKKVIISPAQEQMPQIVANGKRITVDLRDSIQPNTTYTIDFGDAIQDLNEGNILDGFALDFSTGDHIDSLRISGMVFEADNLEPAQGILVGVYSSFTDTTLTKRPMERVARTNQLGQFTIRGLKEGDYRIFAINDINRDNRWDRSEDVAFYDISISPYARTIELTDTLKNSWGEDSLVSRKATEFLPDDILLTWFNEGYTPQYMKNYERFDSTRIFLKFGAPSDTLPEMTILTEKFAGKKIDSSNSVLEANLTNDSLIFWLTDPELVSADSLKIATRYLKTDSTENLSWVTDTLQFNFRRYKNKDSKKKKNQEENDTLPKAKLIDFAFTSPSEVEIYAPLTFKTSEPLSDIDYKGIHLEIKEDTLWFPVDIATIVPDTTNSILSLKMPMKWDEGFEYRITVDSMAVKGIYGGWNKGLQHEFRVKKEDDYAALYFTVVDPDADKMVIELLNSSDQPVRTAKVINGIAEFRHVQPGDYYARGYIDRNGDGKWTTGNIALNRQPEEVFYYPKKISLKKNWDVEQTWNPFETMVDQQKPLEIKKNKPKTKSDDESYNQEDEYDEEDDWSNFGQRNSQYNNAHGNGGFNSNFNNNNGMRRNRNSGF